MSLRSKTHRKERMSRLHQTARNHVKKYGIQGLQLKELAKELGYTTPALYRYYPSKEALIVELQKETLHIMHHALNHFLNHFEPYSPLVKLILCTRFYAAYAENSPASFALNNSVFSSTTIILEGENRDSIILAMRNILLLLQQQFHSLDMKTPSLTMCLWSALHGVLLTKKYQGDFSIPSPDDLVATLLLGWGLPSSKIIEAQHQIAHICDDELLTSYTSLDTKDIS